MPKRGEKKVLLNAICTCPPSARAANSRSASASSAAVKDSAKPRKSGCPRQRPSDPSTIVSPIRKAACMTLSSALGGPRGVPEPHHHLHLGTDRATVEFDRLLASSVKEQVRLDQHIALLPWV